MARWFVAAVLVMAACGGKEECEPEAYQCSEGELLEVCNADGQWEEDTDCAAEGLTCHAEMGHCM